MIGLKQKIYEKNIRANEAHFRLMADLIPEKITNADSKGNVTYYNQKWLEYTGLNIEELKDCGWEKMIHPDDLEQINNDWQQSVNTGNDFEVEVRILNKHGEYKWHLSRAKAVKDDHGKIKLWIGINTEMQTKEEEERKDNFMKMVSHELKTPVTSIRGYVQFLLMMLEAEQNTQIPVQIKSTLIRIDTQVLRLTRLITGMLDISRIDESRLALQKEIFNLNELVIETVEDILYTNAKYTINISQDFKCDINGDKDRIGQVIINLVANAIKYSPNNDAIEVRIYRAGNNEAAVSVKDYGIGIDKTEHQKIFERFYRVKGKLEQTFSGVGIGLFIANSIIERHHGVITVDSEKGKGSMFTFTLPVAPDNKI